MPFSYHSHSGQFCGHADGALEEMVLRAIELGFTHFGLSEHMPRYREEDLYKWEIKDGWSIQKLKDTFESYVVEARRLQKKYADKIVLHVGLETEFIHDESVNHVSALVERHSLDYFVGSVHHVRGIPIDMGEGLYKQAEELVGGTENLFLEYFDHQYELITKLKPKVIGHFDVIRIYRPMFEMTPAIWVRIKRNIEAIVSIGALVEVNSRALKKGLPFPYPFQDVLIEMTKHNVRFTLSDDSHQPTDVGTFYDDVRRYLLSNNVMTLWHLNEKAEPVQYKGEWWTDKFWPEIILTGIMRPN